MATTKNITLVVIDCCASPPFWLTAHCVGAVALIGASFAAPNPVTTGSAIHVISEIYENC